MGACSVSAPLIPSLDEVLVLFRSIDSSPSIRHYGNCNPVSVAEDTQLFKSFFLFRTGRGQVHVDIQEGATIDIESNMAMQGALFQDPP